MKKVFLYLVLIVNTIGCSTTTVNHYAGHEVDKEVLESLVFKAYSTFATGDTKEWAKLHTKDLQFTIFGDLPQSGVNIGTDAVIENVFKVIPVYWPEFALTPIETRVEGNVVFVHNKMTATGLDTETMHMFVIREGKIASFTAFEDTDSMRKSMVK